jgi:hypothetical protein
VVEHSPNSVAFSSPGGKTGIPGSATAPHPTDGIPLPAHGFSTLDGQLTELASVPAAEVISAAGVLLINSAAEKLGLLPGEEPDLDLVDARQLIDALAGLVAAARADLGDAAEPLLAGLRTLQNAFRETAVHPDAPGEGPGERFLS